MLTLTGTLSASTAATVLVSTLAVLVTLARGGLALAWAITLVTSAGVLAALLGALAALVTLAYAALGALAWAIAAAASLLGGTIALASADALLAGAGLAVAWGARRRGGGLGLAALAL